MINIYWHIMIKQSTYSLLKASKVMQLKASARSAYLSCGNKFICTKFINTDEFTTTE